MRDQSVDQLPIEEVRALVTTLAPLFEERAGKQYKDVSRIPDCVLIAAYHNLQRYLSTQRIERGAR